MVVLAMVSCGPPLASVTGAVRIDGEPLEAGTIVFHATDGNYRETQGAYVVDGNYRVAGLHVKPMEIEVMRKDEVQAIGPRTRIDLKPGRQQVDVELSSIKR